MYDGTNYTPSIKKPSISNIYKSEYQVYPCIMVPIIPIYQSTKDLLYPYNKYQVY